MAADTERKHNTARRSAAAWLWVLLCSGGIFMAVPFARSIQKYVYETVGREFFTYGVILAIAAILTVLLFLLIFRLQVRNPSQYYWIFMCAGLYVYFTVKLNKYPEEALHLLEYGLLSFFLFNALSRKIRDWTVYPVSLFFVLFIGIVDEFIQWMVPGRYWGLKDIGINFLGGGLFLLVLWKGIVPKRIAGPAGTASVNLLLGIITANIVFLGLCLSNTPGAVRRYTGLVDGMMWLREEEPMSDFTFPADPSTADSVLSSLSFVHLWGIIVLLLAALWVWGYVWKKKINSSGSAG